MSSAATNPGSVEAPFDRGNGICLPGDPFRVFVGGKVVVNQINLAYRATHGSAKTLQEGVADSLSNLGAGGIAGGVGR